MGGKVPNGFGLFRNDGLLNVASVHINEIHWSSFVSSIEEFHEFILCGPDIESMLIDWGFFGSWTHDESFLGQIGYDQLVAW